MGLEIFGYHGTTLESAQSIVENGFELRPKPWDWLGDGVYFWQDAPRRASLWGEEWTSKGAEVPEVSVVKARLRLEDCLDLLDVAWNDAIIRYVKSFRERLRRDGTNLKNHSDGRHLLDAAFFNFLVEELEHDGIKIRSVRAAIAEGESMLEGSPIRYRSHVQIAIRDVSLISDLEIL